MPKVQRNETLLAFQMNNENILQIHRYPFHAVAGDGQLTFLGIR